MQSFRDDIAPFLGSKKDRKRILRDINNMERTELGLPPMPKPDPNIALQQQSHMRRISTPKVKPEKQFNNFILAPSSLRGKKTTSRDALFSPAPGTDNFWLYGVQKVTQSTLGSLGKEGQEVSDAELFRSQVVQSVISKIDAMAEKAKGLERCGILFDIISTSKIIEDMLPHRVGSFIYEYIETKHSNLVMIKFVFVGITDNVNCCAARDVFCRDEMLKGKYVGQTKRNFDALDNIHIFPVMPPNLRPSSRLSDNGDTNSQVLAPGGGFTSFLTSLESPLAPANGGVHRSASPPPGDDIVKERSRTVTPALKNRSSFNKRRESGGSDRGHSSHHKPRSGGVGFTPSIGSRPSSGAGGEAFLHQQAAGTRVGSGKGLQPLGRPSSVL